MLTLHHLETSRSTRILWLLEELGVEYELRQYKRTPEHRAPPELKAVHPLGKSPVLADDDLLLAESSAILRYLDRTYGGGRFTPEEAKARALHDEWVDFVEGSAATPVLTALMAKLGMADEATVARNRAALATILGFIEHGIAGPFLLGERLTLADMQMAYLLEMADGVGLLGDYPETRAYLARLHEEPGLHRAIAKGGPMMLAI